MDKPELPWDDFNGTREEWGWWYLETIELPSAFDLDDVPWEACIKSVLKDRKDWAKKEADYVHVLEYVERAIRNQQKLKPRFCVASLAVAIERIREVLGG